MNTTPDHPDFTALALGEHIHGAPARPVLDALRTSVAARQEAEQLRAAAAQLSLVLKGQPPQRLDNKRRNEIFNADINALRERFAAEEREEELEVPFAPMPRVVVKRRRTAWVFPTAAAAAVVTGAVALLQLLPGNNGPSKTPSPLAKKAAGDEGYLVITPGKPDASAAQNRTPGAATVSPQEVAQDKTAPPVEEVPLTPEMDTLPPALPDESDEPQLSVLPEVVPTKPPFRNDLRDYASPPRIPAKGK